MIIAESAQILDQEITCRLIGTGKNKELFRPCLYNMSVLFTIIVTMVTIWPSMIDKGGWLIFNNFGIAITESNCPFWKCIYKTPA